MCSSIKQISFWCLRKIVFWRFPHVECQWVSFAFIYALYSWKIQTALVWLTWFPPVVQLSCKDQALSCSARISQAGPLWDHSACQGCCSYLSLPVKTQALAPLHPPRPVERARSACGMQVCSWQQTQWRVCVCARVSTALCDLACWKVSVKVLLLWVGPPCRRCPELANRKQQAETVFMRVCVTLDAARLSWHLPVWNRVGLFNLISSD